MLLLAAVDLNWLLQFIVTLFVVAFGLLHVLRNTASKYFLADDENGSSDNCTGVSGWSSTMAMAMNFNRQNTTTATTMTARDFASEGDACAVCGNPTKKKCSGCKMVMYCSEMCQRSHWRLEHKTKCKDFQLLGKSTLGCGKAYTGSGSSNSIQSKEILFPYEEFLNFFNWDKSGFPPCGLLNCGNSCFANVVLQCLAFTKPLVAFLLEKGHRGACRRNDWCFFCEFETHIGRTIRSSQPFSPINILSRLPNIGGNLGYGKQEDAHEFMRFAIDTMQSVCLDEFGGEKAVQPSSQKTTLIQHIFGGHLQSQVICTNCENVSNQLENMMDLTVEIQGNASSLEQCLDQFTKKEWLHGDNMYKCDGCNDYVMAWKRLTVRQGPNILTIALKRFQSGSFGKLNKRISFPETLDLSPYMSEPGDNNNLYKLYAVIVHIDMLNASFFGHYICYVKDFRGNWYRIDDCKVSCVDIDEVLSQGAYMLLYSRVFARQSSLYPVELLRKDEQENPGSGKEDKTSPTAPKQCQSIEVSNDALAGSSSLQSDDILETMADSTLEEISLANNTSDVKEGFEEEDLKENFPMDVDICVEGSVSAGNAELVNHSHEIEQRNTLSLTDSSEIDVLAIERPVSHPSEVEDATGGSTGINTECLIDNASVPTQNHVDEKEQMPVKFSAVPSSQVDFVEIKSADNCRENTGKAKSGDNLSSSIAEHSTGRRSSRRHSCGNLKPLFAPGFLDRHSQNKSLKGEGKASVKLGQQISNGSINCCRNGIVSPGISVDNGGSVRNNDVHSGCQSEKREQVRLSDEEA